MISTENAIYGNARVPNVQSQAPTITVIDGTEAPRTFTLYDRGKPYRFGRHPDNDIPLKSMLVSAAHGRFLFKNGRWYIEDKGVYEGRPSTNGLIYNGMSVSSRELRDGDMIRIDNGTASIPQGVLFLVSYQGAANQWSSVPTGRKRVLTIGRNADCDIILPHVSVSRRHASIIQERGGCFIQDDNSTNGVLVNGRRVNGRQPLCEKDVIVITNSRLVYTSSRVFYCCYRSGISVAAAHVSVERGKGKKAVVTTNDVSLSINPGELVSIIGGSGAGKSTILNCLCGYLPPSSGCVLINGVSLYDNFNQLKSMIGYVPQADIVYDNLTVHDMLLYVAKLRLPSDTSAAEYEAAINRAVSLVDLDEKKNSFIRALSGGQKKRASIAVELLSDPSLLLLDEPASGLDPGTERRLMCSLRRMADSGKTVILVTHSTLQLELCNKVVFMGKGGNLCYFGSCDSALRFFGVRDVVDIYGLITDNAPYWRQRYLASGRPQGSIEKGEPAPVPQKKPNRRQFGVLCARYARLILNDRQRLLLMLLQAPLLALLISIVADGEQFHQFEMTNSLLFALACSAFWIGILNAIQEICKERSITKREYMTGLSLNAYLLSKVFILGFLCLVQSVMLLSVFALFVGLPKEGLLFHPWLEMLITTFLGAVASTAMGLFVSSLFTNADRAMTLAPILLMPQILFSGLIFKLSGATKIVSWFAVCRWSMEGYGTIANLNSLELRLQQQGIPVEHAADAFYEYTVSHLTQAWYILAAFIVIFLVLARIALINLKKE